MPSLSPSRVSWPAYGRRSPGLSINAAFFPFSLKTSATICTFLEEGRESYARSPAMNQAPPVHPSNCQLAALKVGKLAPPESVEVERHLAACDTCCEAMKTLPDDSLV